MDSDVRVMPRMRASRWVLIVAVFTISAVVAYSWSAHGMPFPIAEKHEPTRYGTSSSASAPPGSIGKYLLGDVEDAARLWYPPNHERTSPQPPTLKQNEPTATGRGLRTPLLIPFTRNNDMLVQAVLSYIAAGWPREDIIVIDNSGTMDANPRQQLSLTNPFYLDYKTLRTRYGVSIIQTPTLLSFSQLQNFLLRLALAHNWRFYFWSHMDVAVLSDEAASPFSSFHKRVLSILADLHVTSLDAAAAPESDTWALKYFTYDWLTLINVGPWRKIGAWDNFIPYYASDCDAYSRLALNGYTKEDVRAGHIFDLPRTLSDPESKFFPGPNDKDKLNSPRFQALLGELKALQDEKPETARNKWQGKSKGGEGDPWTYDPDGFQKMWWATAGFGRELYKKKWGTEECRLDESGVKLQDAFQGMG